MRMASSVNSRCLARDGRFSLSQFFPGRLDLIQCTMTRQGIAIADKNILLCNKSELLPRFREPLGQGVEVLVWRLSHVPWTTRGGCPIQHAVINRADRGNL